MYDLKSNMGSMRLSSKSNRIAELGGHSTTRTPSTMTPRLPFVLIFMFLGLLFGGLAHVTAERDFNVNESQVPVMEPKDEPAYKQDPYVTELIHCQQSPNEIWLSLVLKQHDWSELSSAQRNHVQTKLSKFFAVPMELVTLDSVSKHDIKLMQKSAMRKGGKGSKHVETLKRHLGRASFMIGCGGKYFNMGEPIAKQIAHQLKDGTIGAITEQNFGIWFIWRKDINSKSLHRHRRQSEGSGNEGDDYDDYDYGDDTVETVTEVPITPPTQTTPSMHAHRHHHGASGNTNNNDNNGNNDNTDSVSAHPENADSVIAVSTSKTIGNDNGNNNKLDEGIEESVSKLESVISKTIENTKNIKELPVLSVDDVDEDVDLDTISGGDKSSVLGVPTAPEIISTDKLTAEIDNELEIIKVATSLPPMEPKVLSVEGTTLMPIVTTPMSSTYATVNPKVISLNEMDEKEEEEEEDDDEREKEVTAIEHTPTSTQLTSTSQKITDSSSLENTSGSIKQSPSFSPYDANSSVVSSSTTIETVETAYIPSLSSSSSTSSSLSLPSTTVTSISISTTPSIDSDTVSLTANNHNNNHNINTTTSTTTTIASMPITSISSPPPPPPTTTATTTRTSATQSQMPKMNEIDFEQTTNLPIPTSYDGGNVAEMDTSTMANNLAPTTVHHFETTMGVAYITTPSAYTNNNNNNKGDGEDNPIAEISGDSINGAAKPRANMSDLPLAVTDLSTSTVVVSSSTEATSHQSNLTTTTSASIDYVDPRSENTPPIIKTRLPKIAVTSGKAFSFIVTEDTFTDAEDLNNLRLDLTDHDGHELKHTSWLQFNADKRELYGLPLDDTVSRWQYRLTATDSGNETVMETVEISVQQHRGVRTVNHEISVAVNINERHVNNIDWQLRLIHGIAKTLEDENSSALVVREIRQTSHDPFSATLVYFNETLPTIECPEEELHQLVNRLDAMRLSDLVQPMLSIKSITGQLIGSCLKTEIAKPKPTSHMAKNFPPMPRNQVDRVNASVGQLLVYKVPSDTFFDPNDNELTLTLKTKENNELSMRHWLQFDSKNQEFYGVPKSGDTGSEEYLLVAEDSSGLSATDALVVVVNHAPKKEFSVFFKAYLAIRHENFNADLQRKFVERIAQLHGDSNTNQIQVRSITTHHDSDGTIVNFYNTSLYKSHNHCPDQEVAITRSVYLNSDMVLRDSVKRALGPELNLTNLTVVPFGACHQIADINPHDFPPTRTEEPSLKSTFSEEYLTTFVLPAVIIVVMILLASIIACCLHRRRHKSGKMELGDEEERKSFRTKGIPVIFQDEFDEKPEIGNKSPVILKDEKPPLLAPSYNTSNLNGENDVDEYVPPPAVVVGGREARGKSPATPSYRKPPPYVSP